MNLPNARARLLGSAAIALGFASFAAAPAQACTVVSSPTTVLTKTCDSTTTTDTTFTNVTIDRDAPFIVPDCRSS